MAATGLPPPLGAEMPNDNPELFAGATWHAPTPCAAPRAFREPSVAMLHYADEHPKHVAAAERVSPPLPPRVVPPPSPVPVGAELATPLPVVEAAPLEQQPAELEPPVADCDGIGMASESDAPIPVRLVEPSREAANPHDCPPAEGFSNDFDRFVKSVVGVALKRGETRAAAQLKRFLETSELCGDEASESSKKMLIDRGFVIDDGKLLRPSPSLDTVLSSWRRTLSGEERELDATGEETLDQWASSLLGAWLGCEESNLPTLRRALRKSGVLAFGMRAA